MRWWVLLAAGLIAVSGEAQSPRADSVRAVVWPGRSVRLTVGAVQRPGVVVAVTDSAVILGAEGVESAVAYGDIRQVWTRRRPVARGMAIGAVVGGGLVGSFTVLLISGLCDSVDGCEDSYLSGFLVGGAIGASGGALLGGGVGALIRVWHREWP